MSYNKVLKEMKDSVGTKEPIEYFDKLTDCFTLLFKEIEDLKKDNKRQRTLAALAIEWDPKVASTMLAEQIVELRVNKDVYDNEINIFKYAYGEDKVTQSYKEFCKFWFETLGWHPFMGS